MSRELYQNCQRYIIFSMSELWPFRWVSKENLRSMGALPWDRNDPFDTYYREQYQMMETIDGDKYEVFHYFAPFLDSINGNDIDENVNFLNDIFMFQIKPELRTLIKVRKCFYMYATQNISPFSRPGYLLSFKGQRPQRTTEYKRARGFQRR